MLTTTVATDGAATPKEPWVSEAADRRVVTRLPAEEGAREWRTFAAANRSAARSRELGSGAGAAAVEA
jgi:hypothetical protein